MSRRSRTLAALLALSPLTACAALLPLRERVEVPAPTQHEPPARVLRDEQRLTYSGLDLERMRLDVYRAIVIRAPEGLGYANVVVPAGKDAIVGLQARVDLPSGERVEADLDDAFEIDTMHDGASNEGGHATVLPLPRVVVGAVLQISYSVQVPWSPSFSQSFSEQVPIDSASLTIVYPPMVELQWTARSLREAQHGYDNGNRTLSFESARAIDPQALEPELVPSVRVGWRRLRVAYGHMDLFDSWAAAAKYFWAEVAPPKVKLEPLRTEGRGAQIAEAFERVQRAIPLDAPAGGHLMRGADDLLRTGFAGSDERAILLFYLLESAGMKPQLVVMPRDPMGRLQRVSPAPFTRWGFDFMVLVRGDAGMTWLDPLCLGCRVGELAPQHQGREVIVTRMVAPGGPTTLPGVEVEMGMTPRSAPGVSARADLRLAVEPRGLTITRGGIRYFGERAAGLRRWLEEAPEPDLREDDARRYIDGYADGDVRVGLTGDGTVAVSLSDVLLARSGYVDAAPIVWLPLSTVWRLDELDGLPPDVKTTFRIDADPSFELLVRVPLSAHDRVSALPEPLSIDTPVGSYLRTSAREDQDIVVRERLVMSARTFAGPQYSELKAFARQVMDARQSAIVLERR